MILHFRHEAGSHAHVDQLTQSGQVRTDAVKEIIHPANYQVILHQDA